MELLVLIDSVLSSRYIPAGDAARIIQKLGSLSNHYFKEKIPHVQTVKEWNHQRNKEFFWSLEILSEAIDRRKQVAFIYSKPQEDGELHPLRTEKDRVHPYKLICTNGQYYLIGSYGAYDNLRHYRIDRMTDIEILDRQARDVKTIDGYEHGLDAAKYAAEHGFMHGAKPGGSYLK